MSSYSNLKLCSKDEKIIEDELAQLRTLSREKFMLADQLVDHKLSTAMHSLAQSTASIRLLLESRAAAPTGAEAAATRADLESLLASSLHLEQLAASLQQNFCRDREISENRTDREIANVMQAVQEHRAAVQHSAIALTEAALDRARRPMLVTLVTRVADRPREA